MSNRDVTSCECYGRTRVSIGLLTEHAPQCRRRDDEIVAKLRALIRGIEKWAAEEDGIPEDMFGAYEDCRRMLLPEKKTK